MNKKRLVLLTTAVTTTIVSTGMAFAANDDILDLGDTATTTTSATGDNADTLDLGTGTLTTGDNVDTLDLGDTTTNDNNTGGDTTNENTQKQLNPTYEVVGTKSVKFTFDIPNPKESYAASFKADKDYLLSEVVVNNNNISEQLKNSLSLLIISNNSKKTIKIEDLAIKPVAIKKGDEVYFIYNPVGDNSDELSLSNNVLKVFAKEMPVPIEEGKLNYDNGEIVINNPVKYKEANIKYDVKTSEKTTKAALTKKDTGPVENVLALLAGFLIIGGAILVRK